MWVLINFFLLYFYYSKMISEKSSVRDMFQYPNHTPENKSKKYQTKGHRSKRSNHQAGKAQKWDLTKVVKTIKNVAQFIENLKNRRAEKGSVNEHSLKPNQLEYLQNDSQNQGQTAFFSHDNKVVLITDIFFIAIMMLYFWQCTYQMVLGQITNNQLINCLVLGFYCLHIFLQQVTELKNQKSQLITDLSQIRQIYRKQKFLKDLISITVLALQMTPLDDYESNAVFFIATRLLSLLAYIEMSQTCDKVQQSITISILGETVISFMKLLYKVFIFLHCISIILNWVVTLEHFYGIQTTWLSNPNISYNSNFQKYILAWYWGATILSTVGFGDIIPYNNVQRFIVSIVQVCCCMAFGYFVNTIGQMIKMRSQSSEKYIKEVRSLNRFLSLLTVSNDLKHKIRTHYFNKNQVESMHDPKEEKEVLETITPNLKISLLEEVNLKIIKKCSQLQKFRTETINRIAQSLKRTILAPQYLLYSRNSTERKIWLIQSGTVEEFTDNFSNSKLRKLVSVYHKKEPLVGWINFITPNAYQTLAKAKTFTVAHELDQAEFLKCLSLDSRDYLKLAEIKQILIEKKRKYESKCISCGRYTHNVINCPRIHFIKKQGIKLYKQKKLMDRYLEEQSFKEKRPQNKYNWKKLFGTGKLQKEANLLTNNDSLQRQSGVIETFLHKLSIRESVLGFQKRKASLLVISKQNQKTRMIDIDEKSRPSVDNDQQQMEIEFEKVFINKENDDYFPNFDIQNILKSYNKKRKNRQLRMKSNCSNK